MERNQFKMRCGYQNDSEIYLIGDRSLNRATKDTYTPGVSLVYLLDIRISLESRMVHRTKLSILGTIVIVPD